MRYELHPTGTHWQIITNTEPEHLREAEARADRLHEMGEQSIAEIMHRTSPFAMWLRTRIQRNGLTFTEVGRSLGVGRHTVSNWVAGFSRPSTNKVQEVARLFGEDPARIRTLAGYGRPGKRKGTAR
jgi:hypothetical protein